MASMHVAPQSIAHTAMAKIDASGWTVLGARWSGTLRRASKRLGIMVTQHDTTNHIEKPWGYWQVTGGLFVLYVVELDVVAEHEDDDLLRLFGYHKERTVEARRFWAEQMGSEEAKMAVHELEG